MSNTFISSILLNNFQAHRWTCLELSPGVNVIVGPNDVGKSAIVRAVKSLVYFGAMYERTGATECGVTLAFTDGGKVTRTRELTEAGKLKPGGQLYWLNEREFPKLKNGVLHPDIEEYLNMARVEFEDGAKFSLNIAEQIPSNGPFLIGGGFSGQTRVKILGSLTEQHLFDEGARVAKGDGSSAKKEAKTITNLLREAEEELEKIRQEPPYEVIHRTASRLRDRLPAIQQQAQQKRELLQRLRQSKENCERVQRDKERLPPQARAEELLRSLGAVHRRTREGAALLRTVCERGSSLGRIQNELVGLPDIHRVAELLRSIQDLGLGPKRDLLARFRDAEERLRAVRSTRPVADLGAVDATGEALREHIAVEEQLHTIVKDMKTCPYAPFEVEFQEACKLKV
jgi:exonuclease SbcC